VSDDLKEFLSRARGSIATAIRTAGDGEIIQHPGWGLPALRGRLVELSARGATATLTAAVELVIEAQREAEPVAWIMGPQGSFYPPDVADSGVDLAALVVVRVPDLVKSGLGAVERLLRSGAFGLIVIDLGGVMVDASLPIAHQGRLVTLAQAHDAAVVCITEKSAESSSLGSLVSMRAEALRVRLTSPASPGAGGYELTMRVLKDKRRGPGFTKSRRVRGPAGY
jgi:recombination protein RecA